MRTGYTGSHREVLQCLAAELRTRLLSAANGTPPIRSMSLLAPPHISVQAAHLKFDISS
jgi:hypothetical protein